MKGFGSLHVDVTDVNPQLKEQNKQTHKTRAFWNMIQKPGLFGI